MDLKTIFTVIVRVLLVSIGGALAQHGIIQSSGVEQFVSVGVSIALILGAAVWSIWEKYGRPIAVAQLEIWKLKALARADALKKAGVPVPPPPTAAQVDAATPSSVTPAIAAQAVAIAAKGVVLLALAIGLAATLILAAPASAQTARPRPAAPAVLAAPTDLLHDIARKNDVNAPGGAPGAQQQAGQPAEDVFKKLKADSLADLKYAAALADANGNKTTASCWHAWVDLLEKYDQPLKDAQGNVLTAPNPDLFTGVEKLSELRQALQNGGPIQTGCGALKDAINADMKQLVGLILGGGAGIAKLIPIIP